MRITPAQTFEPSSDRPASSEPANAAYGVPDGFGGDDVMVAVVPVAAGPPLDVAELFEHLERSMPTYMVPRYVDVVDEIPRNATTLRVQKFVLRERGVTATTWERSAPEP